MYTKLVTKAKKPEIKKHFKEDDFMKVKFDQKCLTKGDPCESNNTCENGEICLNDSLDEGFCYPSICADTLNVQYKPRPAGYHGKNKKAPKAKQNFDVCYDKKDQCKRSADCTQNMICLYDDVKQGYCFPRYCIEVNME